MPEIGIADKATLDIIKSKLDENLDSNITSRASQASVDNVLTKLDSFSISPLSYYFPFVGGAYPFNGNASDIIISSNTIWNDACGYKQVGKLTINSGCTLRIDTTPFIIFCDELVFGSSTSTIDINGYSGSESMDYANIPRCWPIGGTHIREKPDGTVAKAQGGCGGGFLIILSNKVTGSGKITANGGNAFTNYKNYDSNSFYCPGQGSCSNQYFLLGSNGALGETEKFYVSGFQYMADGTGGAKGGGSGSGSGSGSGIGSGGAGGSWSSRYHGNSAPDYIPLNVLLSLATKEGCRGGGGGAVYFYKYDHVSAGGGGGGAIVLLTKTLSSTPTLQANGGLGSYDGSPDSNCAGGAGYAKIHIVN